MATKLHPALFNSPAFNGMAYLPSTVQYITQPQQVQPQQQPMSIQQIQPQMNRLTQQANNALYGGLLGYNQNMPLMSGGSNPQSYAAPQGNFRDAFAGMQGLLGGGNWRGGY